MAKRSRQRLVIIPAPRLMEGYSLAIENAVRSLGAATNLLRTFPDKALALAQIGQEEVGKSLTLLAAFALPQTPNAWTWFWKGWREHNLKAHRAYLYELLNPLRIELSSPDGRRYAGEPLHDSLPREKELGLYVDFKEESGLFVAPEFAITPFEAMARTSTLAYLVATADATRRALTFVDSPFRLTAFGDVALRVCSEKIYQQDMPGILTQFGSQSVQHRALLDDLRAAYAGTADFFSNMRGSHEAI
jgi:AbiV family abortive infection protein